MFSHKSLGVIFVFFSCLVVTMFHAQVLNRFLWGYVECNRTIKQHWRNLRPSTLTCYYKNLPTYMILLDVGAVKVVNWSDCTSCCCSSYPACSSSRETFHLFIMDMGAIITCDQIETRWAEKLPTGGTNKDTEWSAALVLPQQLLCHLYKMISGMQEEMEQ